MRDDVEDRIVGGSGAEFSGGAPSGWEVIEMPIVISWNGEGSDAAPTRVSFQTEIRLSWNDVLRHLPIEPKKSWNRISLLRVFSNSAAGTFRTAIERRGFGKVARLAGRINAEVFDRILDALVGQGILEVVERPKYVKQQGRYWRVTEAGLKFVRKERGMTK